jgi:choline dehydrogenase
MQIYDVIIVGAGSSGCALASRLTENASRSVLLVDAGPWFRTLPDHPSDLTNATTMAATFPGHPYNWSFVGNLRAGHPYPMPRGRVVGGSSSINGAAFLRGREEDFDEWAALGNDVWEWSKVLPCYRRSETDLDFKSELHGTCGPIPVRRPTDSELHPISRAFIDACTSLGFAYEADKNGQGTEGVGPIPANVSDGIRMNTALTYLALAAGRKNLAVMADTLVRRVLVEGNRATGIEIERYGAIESVLGGEVVLCAGGLKSPQLLLLSGIGPADDLRAHGVDVVMDSPGVGRNLADHPSIPIRYRVGRRLASTDPNALPLQVGLNYLDPGAAENADVAVTCVTGSLSSMFRAAGVGDGGHALRPSYLSRPVATVRALRRLPLRFVVSQARTSTDYQFLCSVEKEGSRGAITLSSPDPHDPPVIDLDYLSDPEDILRIRTNVRTAVDILRAAPFTAMGASRTAPLEEDLGTEASLDAWIDRNLTSSFHTSCGARMGPESDPLAVTDQRCRVRGIEGLSVVDISVAPTMIRRATNATAIMIAERAAEFLGLTS